MKRFLQGEQLIIQALFDLVASQLQEYVMNPVDFFDHPEEYREVVLDISMVNNIDSTGITFIIGLFKAAANKGKKFFVKGMHPEIYHVFQLIKLDEAFDIELK
jgi:anti-anti-sigma factor